MKVTTTKFILLHGWQITGICDAQQVFSIKKGNTKNPIKFDAIFKIVTDIDDTVPLYSIQNYFKSGYILIEKRYSSNATNKMIYRVIDTPTLSTKIINHFISFPNITSKFLYYMTFKEIIFIEKNITKKNYNKLANFITSNSIKNIYTFDDHANWIEKQNIQIPSSNWLQGFLQFSSTFQFYLKETKSRNSVYIIANPRFQVSFPKHSEKILHVIKEYFITGYIKSNNNISRLIINDENKIIDFFNKYPLIGKKNINFQDWKMLCEIKSNNYHKTEEGLSRIKSILNNINNKRSAAM